MPTYSYRCETCRQQVSVVHAMAARAPTECTCGGPLQRVYEAPAIQMKGLGFARNHHQDLLARAQRDPSLRAPAEPDSSHHHHGEGGHHGISPAVVDRIEGRGGGSE